MQSDPDDFDSDDDFDAPLLPPLTPIAPQQKLPSLRGMGPNNIDDEFNEEDFDDDFDDDFEEEWDEELPGDADQFEPDEKPVDEEIEPDFEDED